MYMKRCTTSLHNKSFADAQEYTDTDIVSATQDSISCNTTAELMSLHT